MVEQQARTRRTAGPADDPERYELIELRSRGGEGELWRATISVDGHDLPVAVKVMHAYHIGEIGEWRQRWQRQAALLQTLSHPALVRVRELFDSPQPRTAGEAPVSDATLYLVMDWAGGITAEEWVSRNNDRDFLDAVRIVGRLAAAVDYLHSGAATGAPVLHRDIKPANVMIDGNDVKLVDFGLARLLSATPMTFAGTPAYLAPEVLAGGPFTEAADRYALGATAYYVITGETALVDQPLVMRAKLLAAKGVDGRDDLADHVLAMMNRDPAMRPASTLSWAQTLAAASVSGLPGPPAGATPGMSPPWAKPPESGPPQPSKSRRHRKAAVVAIIVAVAVVLVGVGAAVAFVALRNPAKVSASGGGTATKGRAARSVPDILALAEADAREMLSSAGITKVLVRRQPSDKPAGTVIDQEPAANTRTSGPVTITLAEPMPNMPDVTGKELSAAQTLLKSTLGSDVKVTTDDVLDDTKTDGTVVAQTPPAGQPAATDVHLRVTRQPTTQYLDEMHPVQGSAGTGTVTMNGRQFFHSLSGNVVGDAYPFDADYDIGRAHQRFKATIGIQDMAEADSSVRFEVYADGRIISSEELPLGQTKDLDLDISGVLRLRLTAAWKSSRGAIPIAYGEARLLDVPGQVPQPDATSPSGGTGGTATTGPYGASTPATVPTTP